MLGARHIGALLATGLAALLGANVFAGTTSEAVVDSSSPGASNQKVGSFLTADHLDTFRKDGIAIVDGLLTETELQEMSTELISRMEKHVAEGVAVDDALINHHLTDPYIFNLTKHPNFLAAASQILDSPRLRIFSSRLLCKLPGTEDDPNSREVPWHQDSQYWPLQPMKEATLWIALDDVTEENGAMDMFTFSAVPKSRGQNLPKIQLQEEVSTEFFIKMDPAALEALPTEKAFKMTLKRGQAEFHDAFILHHSNPNRSKDQRRCAFIVRYIPDYVKIPPNSFRKMFHENYPLPRLN